MSNQQNSSERHTTNEICRSTNHHTSNSDVTVHMTSSSTHFRYGERVDDTSKACRTFAQARGDTAVWVQGYHLSTYKVAAADSERERCSVWCRTVSARDAFSPSRRMDPGWVSTHRTASLGSSLTASQCTCILLASQPASKRQGSESMIYTIIFP